MDTHSPIIPIETDAVVIGAGPVGLYQVFQLGLQGIQAHVLDALAWPGGQPVELYGDKLIYDLPGIPACTGQALVDSLSQQVTPFKPHYHLGHLVSELVSLPDGRYLLTTHLGLAFKTRTVFIAAGVGAFVPKKLPVPALAPFEGKQVFHHPPLTLDATGNHLVVAGGDQAALDWALAAVAHKHAHGARTVTLLHRRDTVQASSESLALLAALCDSGALRFTVGQVTGVVCAPGQPDVMTGLHITQPDGQTTALVADMLIVMQGISPKLGPLTNWGLDMVRKQLTVNTETFETSQRGIFAVGDINTYPGKKKLLVCGFHECVLAAFGAAAIVYPERNLPLEYTSSSTRLQQLLGVLPSS
ncbi:MAG: NAD(P)/FAD-dependent oxidoreductase [Burkholderiales bacterium]|nr:NAD(P)/FAD-dependent oxidoreductase [Burkholderiales bacterium]